MYYPVQIPFALGKAFAEHLQYSEEIIPGYQDFVICFWEILSVSEEKKDISNIIIADGCIDLVMDYTQKRIGYAGMTETRFDFEVSLPSRSMGARFKPGAFHALTGLSPGTVMNGFLPIAEADKSFDVGGLFTLPYHQAKEGFKRYVGGLIKDKPQHKFDVLFDELSADMPSSVSEIYQKLHFSPRQCQRLFRKHYGLSPQMALCILRFQKCLALIASRKTTDILDAVNYYDQAHFINDCKRHIGITPLELARILKAL